MTNETTETVTQIHKDAGKELELSMSRNPDGTYNVRFDKKQLTNDELLNLVPSILQIIMQPLINLDHGAHGVYTAMSQVGLQAAANTTAAIQVQMEEARALNKAKGAPETKEEPKQEEEPKQ